MKKIRTDILISEELFENVRKIATEVYGVHRGSLSYAVEEGLRLWLLNHSGTLIGTHQNPRAPVREVYNIVMDHLSSITNNIPTSLPTPHFTACVMRALNIKDRSACGWIFRFYVEGLIKILKPPGGKIFKPSEVRHVQTWELVAKEA